METKDYVLVIAALVILVLMIALGTAISGLIAERRVADIRQQQAAFEEFTDSIRTTAAGRDVEITRNLDVVAMLMDRNDSLRAELDSTRAELADSLEATAYLRTFDDIEGRFIERFPRFETVFRVTRRAPTPGGPTIRYAMLPTAALNLMMDLRDSTESLATQLGTLSTIDTTSTEVIARQDSVIDLVSANERMFRAAFDTTKMVLDDRTEQLVREIKKPRFSLGVPSLLFVAVGAAAGFLLRGPGSSN